LYGAVLATAEAGARKSQVFTGILQTAGGYRYICIGSILRLIIHRIHLHLSHPHERTVMLFSSLLTLSLGALGYAMPSQLTARAPSAADQKAYLSAHNTFRASHGAAALVWNQTLSDAGAKWAKKCVFQHSGGTLGPFGENLFAATGSTSPAAAVKAWTDEASTSL
jgi:hypothetical protein